MNIHHMLKIQGKLQVNRNPLYTELLNSEPKKQRLIIDKIIDYLTYSNEELAIFNIKSYKWIPFQVVCNIVSILVSVFLTLAVIVEFKITGLLLLLLILLLPTFIISIPVTIIWLKSKDFKINLISINSLIIPILRNFGKVVITSSRFLLIYLLLNTLTQTDLINLFASPDLNKPLKFDLIVGNQLSLASIFFTLAMGGTVVFSVLKRHGEQIIKVDRTLFKLKKKYVKWVEENKLDDKIFSFDKAKVFNVTVDNLRDKLEPRKVFKLKVPILVFSMFRYFILLYYFMGISAIMSGGFVIDWIFAIGFWSLIPYIIILFAIFKYYQ